MMMTCPQATAAASQTSSPAIPVRIPFIVVLPKVRCVRQLPRRASSPFDDPSAPKVPGCNKPEHPGMRLLWILQAHAVSQIANFDDAFDGSGRFPNPKGVESQSPG